MDLGDVLYGVRLPKGNTFLLYQLPEDGKIHISMILGILKPFTICAVLAGVQSHIKRPPGEVPRTLLPVVSGTRTGRDEKPLSMGMKHPGRPGAVSVNQGHPPSLPTVLLTG